MSPTAHRLLLASLRSDPPEIAALAGGRLLRAAEESGDLATLLLAAKACLERGFHESAASRGLAIALGALGEWASFSEAIADRPSLRSDPLVAALALRSARASGGEGWLAEAASLLLDSEWGKAQSSLAADAEFMEAFTASLTAGDASFLSARVALAAREYGKARASFDEMAEGGGSPGRLRYWRDAYRAFLYDGSYKAGLEFFSKAPQGAEPVGIDFVRNFASARYLEALGRAKEAVALYRQAMGAAFEPGQRIDSAYCALRATLSLGPSSAVAGLKEFLADAGGVAGCQGLIDELMRSLVWDGRWKELQEAARVIAADESPGNAAAYLRARAAYISIRVAETRFGMPADAARAAYRELAASNDAAHGEYYRFLALARAGTASDLARTRAGPAPAAAGAPEDANVPSPINAPAVLDPLIKGFIEFGQFDELISFIAEGAIAPAADEARALLSALAKGGEHAKALSLALRYVDLGVLGRGEAEQWLFPRPWKDAFEAEAEATGLDEAVLYALARVESAFDPRVVSKAGAKGLTQLMDSTAQEEARKLKIDSFDPFDPALNLKVGAAFFADQRRRRGSLWLASLAYNGGPSRILRLKAEKPSLPPDLFIEGLPVEESRQYARKMLVAYCHYRYVYSGESYGDGAAAFLASD